MISNQAVAAPAQIEARQFITTARITTTSMALGIVVGCGFLLEPLALQLGVSEDVVTATFLTRFLFSIAGTVLGFTALENTRATRASEDDRAHAESALLTNGISFAFFLVLLALAFARTILS